MHTPDEKMEIIGYYDENGYQIENHRECEILYQAGNNPLESSSYVPVNEGLPIKTIREYCERTGKEMAKENNAYWLGAYRLEKED